MGDVIRLIKSQKDTIEKLIPSLLKEYENLKPTGVYALDQVREHLLKAIKDRDYSNILSILIVKASHDMDIDISK